MSKTLQNFSRMFCDLQMLISVVTCSIYNQAGYILGYVGKILVLVRIFIAFYLSYFFVILQGFFRENALDKRKKATEQSLFSVVQDITKVMPKPLFDETKWGLKKILAVKVSFSFTGMDGYFFVQEILFFTFLFAK